ncbi:MAG: two-component system response regulator [Rhodospirillales bacterium]
MSALTVQDLKVLIVDDDRSMRTLIRNVLMQLGVQDVSDVPDGAQALEDIRAFRPNLILCDMKMEPVGGIEFVRQLRADKDSVFRFVPIIMITAYADLNTVAEARDAGVTEFMAKPLSAAALEKRINRVLKNSRPFVEAPDFAGPDRRRNQDETFGGAERRAMEPNYIESPLASGAPSLP